MTAEPAHLALRAIDATLALAADAVGGCVLLARHPRRRAAALSARPQLLVLSTMYTLDVLRARNVEFLITHSDLDGYFERVWSVHPLVEPIRATALGATSTACTR